MNNLKKISLKDILFNVKKIEQVAKEIQLVHPSFNSKKFIRDVINKFPELELKARISWIAECLKKYLPNEYKVAANILIKALPHPNNPDLSDNDFGDFIYAPYAEFIAKNGCTKAQLKFSLNALYEITQRFSAEDAIRYFINKFPKETLSELLNWTNDSHYHVRRLCSEGTRPKLPWSQKINIPTSSQLTILDKLFSDKTRYVTRSVANHLNDIAKSNPDLVIKTLTKWKKSGKQKSSEMEYIIRHALRTLIKQGNSKAMELIGFSSNPGIKISKFTVPTKLEMNEPLEFSFSIESKNDSNIIIDYIIYFQNKSGKPNSKKVFKLKEITLKKNSPIVISKRHPLRQFMTTRTLYAGKQEIELQINGKAYNRESFILN